MLILKHWEERKVKTGKEKREFHDKLLLKP
jgi:hypothetical protein